MQFNYNNNNDSPTYPYHLRVNALPLNFQGDPTSEKEVADAHAAVEAARSVARAEDRIRAMALQFREDALEKKDVDMCPVDEECPGCQSGTDAEDPHIDETTGKFHANCALNDEEMDEYDYYDASNARAMKHFDDAMCEMADY